jgi:hypothetical protein
MEGFRVMVENVILPGEESGETSLPTGWERGCNLTLFTDETLFSGEVAPPLQEVSGIIEKWDPPAGEQTLAADDGRRYTLQLGGWYYFRGLPIGRLNLVPSVEPVQEGDRVRVAHYTLTAPGVIQPEFVAVERGGTWQPVYYKSFFDLTRETFDSSLPVLYPQDVPLRLWLRGPLSVVAPFLVDEAGQPLTPESLPIELSEQVLATGMATNAGGSPRMILEELFVFDGQCVPLVGGGEECGYVPAE